MFLKAPHVLGPTFFSDYIAPLSNIFSKWSVSFYSYADDTQIYVPFTSGVDEDEVFDKLVKCVHEVKIWMAANFLKLNDDKTDYIVIGNRCLLSKCKHRELIVSDNRVSASSSVENIGASLESSLSMETKLKQSVNLHGGSCTR